MFLLVVDGKSKWIEVFSVLVTTVYATILAVHFFFATHGLPEELVLDIGLYFVAQETKDFTFKESVKTIKDEPGKATETLFPSCLSDYTSYSHWLHSS